MVVHFTEREKVRKRKNQDKFVEAKEQTNQRIVGQRRARANKPQIKLNSSEKGKEFVILGLASRV
jgi:hypothetical protein